MPSKMDEKSSVLLIVEFKGFRYETLRPVGLLRVNPMRMPCRAIKSSVGVKVIAEQK